MELQGRWHCERKELREGTSKCAASASSPALTVHSRERHHHGSNVRTQCRSRTYSFNLRQQPQQDEHSMWNAHGHESARFRKVIIPHFDIVSKSAVGHPSPTLLASVQL